jgi:hypothetical protein
MIHAVLDLIRVQMVALEEERAVAEDVDDSLHILIGHLGILRGVLRVHLDVRNELNQKLERELVALVCDFDQKVLLRDDATPITGLVTVEEGLPQGVQVEIVDLIGAKILADAFFVSVDLVYSAQRFDVEFVLNVLPEGDFLLCSANVLLAADCPHFSDHLCELLFQL